MPRWRNWNGCSSAWAWTRADRFSPAGDHCVGLHLIIDGYNLIRNSPSLSGREAVGLEEGRRALLERLSAYKRIKAMPVTVVFDAAEGPHLRERTEHRAGIKVVFSGAGRTADQVIVNMARDKGARALVVTSDRALARAVTDAGATAVGSPEFEDRMEMAFYMETKGLMGEDEEPEPTLSTRKKGPSRRSTKSVRKKAARMRKL